MGGTPAEAPEPAGVPEGGAPPAQRRFRRSHPYRAFAWMVLPMFAAPPVVFIPFIGWVLLLVLLPIELGRIGGKRIARPDALWVAVPASLAVSIFEVGLVWVVLDMIPGQRVGFDALGTVLALIIFSFNGFFYSVGALSTSFDPRDAVPPDARSTALP